MGNVFVKTMMEKNGRLDSSVGVAMQIARCGGNTGNVCWEDAVDAQIITDRYVELFDMGSYAEAMGEETVFVLPVANWINRNEKVLELSMANLNPNVKLLVLGLGIQMQGEQDTPKKLVRDLPEERIRALKTMSEHSEIIAVRGPMTAEVLDLLGIHNHMIIGCPSYYEPYRKWGKAEVKNPDLTRGVCNVTPYTVCGARIIEIGHKEKLDMIMQAMAEMPLAVFENKEIELQHMTKRYPGVALSLPEFTTYLKNHGKIFWTRDTWTSFYDENDIAFSFGNRFHGNMMAFTSGVPALWVYHDARIKEMTEIMHLPAISQEKMAAIKDAEELLEFCVYDDNFKAHYLSMSEKYVALLERYGLNHRFGMKR